jgi:hypothetical protein
MKRRSPTLEGFRSLFRLPSLGLAEITWRWSFGLAVSAFLAFSFREYMSTLPVTAGEMFLLKTRQPALVLQAMARILQGSAPRAVNALIVLALAATLAWIVLASLGRAATLEAIVEYFRENHEPKPRTWRLGPLLGLNFLRAAASLAAVASCVGAVLLAGAASSETHPSPASAWLIFWMLILLIGIVWCLLNWYLSLAAIFVVGQERTTFGALAAAGDLCRNRPGRLAAVAIWFGAAHAVAFVTAVSLAAFPLAFVALLPAAVVLGGVILVALIYFAVVDFLHVGRLAAHVYLADSPEPDTIPVSAANIPPAASPGDDDILSDIPGLIPSQPATG